MLGPLYHLTERNDRVAAVREALRVLRDDGLFGQPPSAGLPRCSILFAGDSSMTLILLRFSTAIWQKASIAIPRAISIILRRLFFIFQMS
jgi:hypothetical protein